MSDIDSGPQVHAVTRELRDVERDGEPMKAVVATQTYADPIADVWDALTTPERLARWFAPVSGDFRLGGRFQIEGNAEGEVLTCEEPHTLAITWEFNGGVSWVDVVLAEVDGGTRLTLTHTAPPIPGFWDTYGPGAVGIGWDLALLGLALHLPDPERDTRAEALATWEGGDDYRAFVDGTAASWAAAARTAGVDAEVAAGWEAATAAFYKGEEAPPEGGS